jgi:hypothetical protein
VRLAPEPVERLGFDAVERFPELERFALVARLAVVERLAVAERFAVVERFAVEPLARLGFAGLARFAVPVRLRADVLADLADPLDFRDPRFGATPS